MATEVIPYFIAHSPKAATQRRNIIVRYRSELLTLRDAMANVFMPIASTRGYVDAR